MLQLSCGDDPQDNLKTTLSLFKEATAAGAGFVLTPEATNFLSPEKAHTRRHLCDEADDPTLAALCTAAETAGVWLLIGSLLIKEGGRGRNRSYLIDPNGRIAARYDKIHLFDAHPSAGDLYRESDSYAAGTRAVVAQGPTTIGFSICYDLRFPRLYRRLAQAGARILTVPAAFTPTTGAAHWQVLLRARAIETGCFVLAPAQCGTHPCANPALTPRQSYGHSLAISPWGEVLADGGTEPGVIPIPIDLAQIESARHRIPSLCLEQDFTGP